MRSFVRSLMMVGALSSCAAVAALAFADGAAPRAGTSPGAMECAPPASPHGIVNLVGEALSGVEMEPRQRAALDELGMRVVAAEMLVDQARQAFLLAIADEMESSSFDVAELEDEARALVDARTKMAPVMRSAIIEMHAILDERQRAAFADETNALLAEREEVARSGKWLDRLAAELELTDQQKEQIGQVLLQAEPMHRASKERLDAVLTEFRGEVFLADEALSLSEAADRAEMQVATKMGVAATVHGILTPEQRVRAAAMLRNKACGRVEKD